MKSNYESEFDKLSKALDPEERESLLKKIQESNKVSEVETKSSHKETYNKRQYAYAKNIINTSDIITRFIVWVISIFTGRKKEDIVLNRMFLDIRNDISTRYGNIIDFKNNLITKSFSDEILNLSDFCESLIPVFSHFFQDPLYYTKFLSSLVEKNFNNELIDFLKELDPSKYVIGSDYIEKPVYFKEKDRRLNKFFQKTSLVSMSGINKFFEKFELIMMLVNFDFKSLIYEFTKADLMGQSKQGIHFVVIENLLERLYILLNSIDFSYDSIILVEEMIEFSAADENKNIDDIESNFIERDIENIKYLFNAIANFKKNIPLNLIFQYFKKDVLYSPKPLKVKFDVFNLYKEYKKKLVDGEWNEYYEKIGDMSMKKALHVLFKDYDFNTLDYFNLTLKKILDDKSHVKLKNVKRINLVANFLEQIYKIDIEKIMNKILVNGNFAKESDRSSLATNYYLLKNYADKLRSFDENLDEEKELGKKINTYTRISVGDIDFAKTLQNTVVDINLSTDEMLEEVFNALWYINHVAVNLSDKSTKKSLILLNFDDMRFPGYINAGEAIEKIKELFEKFFRIYNLINDI